VADECWGSDVDQTTWNSILLAGGDALSHDLWCAVIRTVAAAVLAVNRTDGSASATQDDCDVDALIADWQNDSMPVCANLGFVLGEYDYFRDIDMSWDEKVSLSGMACGYPSDVVWDLKNRLEDNPDAQDGVTEDSVEEFFSEWRTRFLRRVFQEAEAIESKRVQESRKELPSDDEKKA
jgi:hypothetical protein